MTSIPDEQRMHRVLVRVESIHNDGNSSWVEVIVPSWSPEISVLIPIDYFGEAVRDHLKPDDRLIAMVNIGASKGEDLRFEGMDEILPEPEEMPWEKPGGL